MAIACNAPTPTPTFHIITLFLTSLTFNLLFVILIYMMNPRLKTTVIKKTPKGISLEIRKEDFEAFCAAAGLYRKEFLNLLEQSEKDHKEGRVTKRESLAELIKRR